MINPIIKEDVKRIIDRLGSDVFKLKGKTILITGASGLIGSYIVETIAFLNSEKKFSPKCKILGLQKSKVTKDSRLGYLLGRSDVEFVSHDAAKPYSSNFKINLTL